MVKAPTASQKRKKVPYGKTLRKRKRKTRSLSVSYVPFSGDEEYNKNSPPYIPLYTTNDELNNVTKKLDYLAVRKPNRRTRNKKLRKKIKKSRRMR
tara:strand:+ start:1350 stop:1637 length:288 start_codon:yes stop_codon:yes gene_type:complete